ncbi:MAG: hypothetical protein KAH23_00230, partial [Kiritimatiellae bacterium]|nr:hypothetical protein [Kiritimatiellia bacterium]
IRRGDRMLDWALLIRANLASVARALESPVYVDDIQETVKLVLSGTKPDLLRRAFDMVVRDLSEHPQEVRLKDFMRLAKKMPAGEVFDAVSIIVGYHNCLNHSGVIDVRALFQDLFYSVENKHYEKIFTEINSIKEDTPDIRKKMDDIYALAGTPATCLLLSNKIKSAGDRQSAEFYRRKTVDFLANVNSYCIDDRNSYLRWKAIRDLASIPGFQEEARNYQDKVHLRNVDSLFIMEAILDSYTGNIEGVIRKMEKSVGRHIRKDKDTYIYDGRLYRTVKGVREALLGNVIKQTNLSAEHIDRISRLGGIDLKVILTKLKGDEICDTQSQFSFEMKDGTTVVGVIDVKSIMVKTSYADIDLSVEKILSITLRSGRKSSEVHLRNNDVVIGGVDMGSINVKTRDGQVSVNGKDLRMMTLYISSVDRFRREIKRLSAGKR